MWQLRLLYLYVDEAGSLVAIVHRALHLVSHWLPSLAVQRALHLHLSSQRCIYICPASLTSVHLFLLVTRPPTNMYVHTVFKTKL